MTWQDNTSDVPYVKICDDQYFLTCWVEQKSISLFGTTVSWTINLATTSKSLFLSVPVVSYMYGVSGEFYFKPVYIGWPERPETQRKQISTPPSPEPNNPLYEASGTSQWGSHTIALWWE